MSYFNFKKFIILIDNFDNFDTKTKEFILTNKTNTFIIISNKLIKSKLNSIKIENYTRDYLIDLYNNIYFLETGYNCDCIQNFKNINEMYSILDLRVSSFQENKKQVEKDIEIIYDCFNYNFNDFIKEKKYKR